MFPLRALRKKPILNLIGETNQYPNPPGIRHKLKNKK